MEIINDKDYLQLELVLFSLLFYLNPLPRV